MLVTACARSIAARDSPAVILVSLPIKHVPSSRVELLAGRKKNVPKGATRESPVVILVSLPIKLVPSRNVELLAGRKKNVPSSVARDKPAETRAFPLAKPAANSPPKDLLATATTTSARKRNTQNLKSTLMRYSNMLHSA